MDQWQLTTPLPQKTDRWPANRKMVDAYANGVRVYQVTFEPQRKSNIYCESTYAIADSSCFVYCRRSERPDQEPFEYVVVNLRDWECHVLATGNHAMPHLAADGWLYATTSDGSIQRTEVLSGAQEHLTPTRPIRAESTLAVSNDRRFLLYNHTISHSPQRFAIAKVDLTTGVNELLLAGPDINNPHLQFNPGNNRSVMVQHNRGCRYSATGEYLATTGPEGATLFLLDVVDGTKTPLAIGHPHTAPITGHQAWLGESHKIVATLCHDDGNDHDSGHGGNILVLDVEQSQTQAVGSVLADHIGATPCGRYFSADSRTPDQILVGSLATGQTAFVGHHHSSWAPEFRQDAHAHPYLTPDLRWVIFNSDRTGIPQIYAAEIPANLIASLDDS